MISRMFQRFLAGSGLLVVLLSAMPGSSLAAEISDRFSLNGFYTLDASLSDGADIHLPSISSDSLTLKDGEVSLENSLIGLQADLDLSDRLSLTAQVISTKQTDSGYKPSVEWAYLSYDLGDDLLLRAGKFKVPLLQGTELRYIGFSRLWTRPLVPSSGAGGFDEYRGAEFIKGTRLGDYNLTFQGAYGKADHEKDRIDSQDVKLLSLRAEKDGSWLNLGLFNARYNLLGADGSVKVKDAELLMGSIEAEAWFDNAVVNAGYAYGDAEVSPDETLAYLSLGYRHGRLTPYLLYQYREMVFATQPQQVPLSPPPPGSPPGPPQNLRVGAFATHGYSLGLRYDLGETYAIKAQVERELINEHSRPALGPLDFTTTIYSLVFEGVF